MWHAWKHQHTYPAAGGWRDQPLCHLSTIQAIDLTFETWRSKNAKDFDWGRFTATQRELIRWLDG